MLSREVRRRGKVRAAAIESLESRKLLTVGLPSLVSVNSAGAAAGNGSPDDQQSLSADGRYLVFSDTSSNLVAGDTNGTFDVFLRDLQTGTTTLVSRTAAGTAGNGLSYHGVISADGRYVAFYSDATDLNVTAGAVNSTLPTQIYRWDRLTGETLLVSINATGTDGASNATGLWPFGIPTTRRSVLTAAELRSNPTPTIWSPA
ncbi:MAG: hypothetical protein R3C19_06645 [Planctomycetaceae bacterium]